jgi:hypothetical protein
MVSLLVKRDLAELAGLQHPRSAFEEAARAGPAS